VLWGLNARISLRWRQAVLDASLVGQSCEPLTDLLFSFGSTAFISRRIMMLHSFIKKSQKTPQRELEVARKRMKEVKDANS
jgi:hypothetical protein